MHHPVALRRAPRRRPVIFLVDSRYDVLPECARQAAFGCPDLDQCPQQSLYLRPEAQGQGALRGAEGLGACGFGSSAAGSGDCSG